MNAGVSVAGFLGLNAYHQESIDSVPSAYPHRHKRFGKYLYDMASKKIYFYEFILFFLCNQQCSKKLSSKMKKLRIQICRHVDYVHPTVIPAYDLVGIILANDKKGEYYLYIPNQSLSTRSSKSIVNESKRKRKRE
jgi:hypothetical protein